MSRHFRKQLAADTLIVLTLFILISCGRATRVSAVEVNNPWMVVDAWKGSLTNGHFVSYADKANSDILYLVEVDDNPKAFRIDLNTKKIAPYYFNVKKMEDIEKLTDRYESGFNSHSLENDTYPNQRWEPLRSEFRGKKFSNTYTHWYGYPVASKPSNRTTTFGSGKWVLVDHRAGQSVELLRYEFLNIEMDLNGFNELDFGISPNRKWITYRLPYAQQPIFIFNRDSSRSPPDYWTSSRDYLFPKWPK